MCAEATSPLFSIVMPTYGVERFIANAVADVLVQTCRDFELIIVDDCSPDRSIEVARAVAEGDERVRIVVQEANAGAAAARNAGIELARGDWCLFLDPDDRYADTLLETLREAIGRDASSADAVDTIVYGHVQEYYDSNGSLLYENNVPVTCGRYRKGPELGRAAIELEQQTHLGYVWNKAYRLSVIRDHMIRFEPGLLLIEDIMFNLAFLEHAQAMLTLNDIPYRYAKRLSSNQTNEFVPQYFDLHRRRICAIRDFCEEQGVLDGQARSTLGALYARFILSALERNVDPRADMSCAQRAQWLHSLYDDPLFGELVSAARAQDSLSLAACISLLNTKNTPLLLGLGRVIHIVRKRSTLFYSKVKSGR